MGNLGIFYDIVFQMLLQEIVVKTIKHLYLQKKKKKKILSVTMCSIPF